MIKKIIPKSSYARNVLTLMTGTGLAQALPIAISPILTRLYTPEDFGVFALYVAIVSILAVVVTGRYELAIMLPKEDKDAFNILVLSVSLSLVISLALLILIVFKGDDIAYLLKSPKILPWLYWIPVSTVLTGIYQSLNYWCNRKSHYSRLAISRVFQSGGGAGGQLGMGLKGASTEGLIGGQILGVLLSTTILAKLIIKEERKLLKKTKKKDVLSLAIRYKNFPKFLVIAHGFNTVSSQIALIVLNSFFNATVAGLYMLTQRVLGAPITLVAKALGDVFRQEASFSYTRNGECLEVYKSTLKKLVFIAIPSFLLFYFIAPELFSFVFGKEWREAGEYAQILTPMFFLRFITSPLSTMFMIAEKQKLDLVWQIFLLILASTALIVGYILNSVTVALYLYTSAYVILFLINFIMTYKMAKGTI
ncbi:MULTISPECIES: lipopolysaccharide biosynthesis protein [Idiomarina]|uniref:lipopolysaccharide biosynthesis protein n=1 Tax=Idiomarina TaxID=135575 RepID=UPI000C3BFFD9|nr:MULTISPECIES: oligosaccharide flippase family protein [Idiomarina]MBP59133.1 translocase [Idiomarina sp.]